MKVLIRGVTFVTCLLFSINIFAVDLSKNLTVNFVTEANYAPFEYLDEQQQIQGFDIDIANAVCEVASLNCQFHNQSFDSLLLTLQFGRFDAVIAALDITKERQSKVDFSDSYYQSPPVFVSAKKDEGGFYLFGKSIGVQADSSNHHYLLKHAKDNSYIISYLSAPDAFRDLILGKIDVVFADRAAVEVFLAQESPSSSILSINKIEDAFLNEYSAGYGIAVKKGNEELLQRLNYGLNQIKENGTYKKIFSSYFKLNN